MLPPVHDATDRRIRLRRHLDQVEVLLAGTTERLSECDDPDLGAVGVDEADARDLDLGVDSALLLFDADSLLVIAPPWQDSVGRPTGEERATETSPSRAHATTTACDPPRLSWQVGHQAASSEGSADPSRSLIRHSLTLNPYGSEASRCARTPHAGPRDTGRRA